VKQRLSIFRFSRPRFVVAGQRSKNLRIGIRILFSEFIPTGEFMTRGIRICAIRREGLSILLMMSLSMEGFFGGALPAEMVSN
jgi:hypothetical protein